MLRSARRRASIGALFAGLALVYGYRASALQNQLAGHPSPYLAMHGNDPVHWQDWSSQILARARREGKLLFISSGYFACHWCHVMQRESYADLQVANRLNQSFVPVKLDRELHAALDAYLIGFVQRTRGAAGWPLNVFVTPEGYPLLGLTYEPRDTFYQLVSRLAARWDAEPVKLAAMARRAALEPTREAGASTTPLTAEAFRAALLAQVFTLADELAGGFGDESRFPLAPQLLALLELQQTTSNPRLQGFLTTTLDAMANEGLRDHLAGGFFRYTVDPSWQTPHYEKMLYTQALVAELFMTGAEVLQRTNYQTVTRETLDFVLNEMAASGGGYIASLSAVDAAGVEGGAYLWNDAQLAAVLNPQERELARRHWRLDSAVLASEGALPMRGTSVDELAVSLSRDRAELDERLVALRKRLVAARGQRALPRDTKVLAGWNGLLLGVLTEAGTKFDDRTYQRAAKALAATLIKDFWDGKSLLRARGPQGALGVASLADYAYLAWGLDRLARHQGDTAARELRDALIGVAWERHFGPKGWRRSGVVELPGMAWETALGDGPLPSPSAMLIVLSRASTNPKWRDLAEEAVRLGLSKAAAQPFNYAGHARVAVR